MTDAPHPPASDHPAAPTPQARAASPEHAAYLALQLLALRLRDEAEELLKAGELSVTQFNVLRILRGADGTGLTCGEIGARLLNRDPDVTRLLDRMEKQGLVRRERSAQDRRAVLTWIDERGAALIRQFDRPMEDLHHRQFSALSPLQLAQLTDLLHLLARPAS